ncbi:hypothetical protein UB44_06665 [Burkholderiaceae bacterium 26]|nr:hypothetical protein UB44_06665 [Burkholderiaceae bacterium 26]
MKKRVAKLAILLGWLAVGLGVGSTICGLLALKSGHEGLFDIAVLALIGLVAGGVIAISSGLVALLTGKRLQGACIGLSGVCLLLFATFVVSFAAAPPVGSIPS